MAKRLHDTNRWDKEWYMGLPPRLKCFWDYLCDKCDGFGVWPINFKLASTYIGEEITLLDVKAFEGRVVFLSDSKLWVPSWLPFHYKKFKTTNKVHVAVANKIVPLVRDLDLNGDAKSVFESLNQLLVESQLTPNQEVPDSQSGDTGKRKKEKGKGKEEKEEIGGVGEREEPPSFETTPKDQELCEKVWLDTLTNFGVERKTGCTYQEKVAISQAIKKHGVAVVSHALLGRRIEPPTDSFIPKNYPSIHRTFKPDKIDEFADLGKRYRKEQSEYEAVANDQTGL